MSALGGLRLRHRRAALSGRLDNAFTRFARPWTGGVGVPDGWASCSARREGYYELGWGWLVVPGPGGERLLYAVAGGHRPATRWRSRNGARSFKAWTLLLCPSAPSPLYLRLSLLAALGALRVLVSVHAFTRPGARGMFILALRYHRRSPLFAVRGHRVRSRVNNTLWSRESLLLGNNVLLMAAMLVVLLGTLLPPAQTAGAGQHFAGSCS